ncbi:HRDC domain-containing protein [Flavobacterium sp. RSB2_4_14]|uniref:HRDC domain-containing protein n=1 Tax=Flavobacterium sp. RSB2_4_14 TaxID=3447665 RepID=UPI003F39E6BA
MNIKVFNIRLSKEHCQNDQQKMNDFLDSVEVKLTSTNFVTTGTLDYWSAFVFFKPKNEEKIKTENKLQEDDLLPDELKIYRALRHWRNDLAERLSWSAFRICHNTHLIAIAKAKPQTIKDLENVSSFGKVRTEKYGDDILAVLNAI